VVVVVVAIATIAVSPATCPAIVQTRVERADYKERALS